MMNMLPTVAGLADLVLGVVYTCYGVIALAELRRERGRRGTSRIGWAWVAMAFTCGPHHLEHGIYLLRGGSAGLPELIVVLVAYPAAITWLLLRVEALRGGPGDRPLHSEAAIDMLRTMLAAAGIIVVAELLTTSSAESTAAAGTTGFFLLTNSLLAFLYAALGALLVRTQLRRHAVQGEWSLSGLTMATIFPTWAAMHAVEVGHVATGAYSPDVALVVVDALAVPAAAYFLVATWMISEGRVMDWARPSEDVPAVPPSYLSPMTRPAEASALDA